MVPDSLDGHGHGHGHGHGGNTGHSHDDADVDGREKRASKDVPGRHDEAYYGAPGKGPRPGEVGASQGARSFARGKSARKRPV